ncbi:hypothetical protein P5F67_11570 [Clostridium perfringens]|uniref:hypothetical protein n=1 Tax=Clostridium TaxID=1485 RepID=UPI00103C6FA6|nr:MULTISPECIES: hypothetical protein [Clostridium]EGT0688311.1 hypothetical protein [Clostridium perfringens]ELC8410910.1 hypothetical protein [Clostridium perfringens]ELC8411775.1 hypothetical protein [Clostridium perfringens]MDK0556823.1 hypothetical protein [Clostridium perfringens]MDK0872759.1 hypothetical protein [Clostridium perfringens]
MDKKREGKVSIKKTTKSKKKGQIYDLTREITGLDSEHLLFDAKRQEVTRLINNIKKVSDIPKDLELGSKNFDEFSEWIKTLLEDNELSDINKRIYKGKHVTLEEYDLIIHRMKEIIDKRDDDDLEKKMLSSIIDNMIPSKEEEELINTINDNMNNIISSIMEFDNSQDRINYYRKFNDTLEELDMNINMNLANYDYIKEVLKLLENEYPQLKNCQVDISNINKVGIDCIAEYLGIQNGIDDKKNRD